MVVVGMERRLLDAHASIALVRTWYLTLDILYLGKSHLLGSREPFVHLCALDRVSAALNQEINRVVCILYLSEGSVLHHLS